MPGNPFVACCILVGLSVVGRIAAAQEKPQPPAQPKPLNPAIAAKVEGEPVLVREVDRELARALGKRKLDPQAERILRAQTLEQLIGRQLVLRYLKGKNSAASKADIELQLERIKKQLKQQSLSLPEYLARGGLDEPEFRRTLAWQLSWQRYLDQQLTDENLKKFFDKNPREFDGSQVRAAHILFKADPADDEARQKALAQAAKVRDEIVQGKLTFAKAAQTHSAAPTAAEGGDIGFISRHEPMPESFSKAAFALEPDAVSPPVVSPFGVHLILCKEVKPGQTTWQEVRGELETAVTRYLFDWIVGQERGGANIEYIRSE